MDGLSKTVGSTPMGVGSRGGGRGPLDFHKCYW